MSVMFVLKIELHWNNICPKQMRIQNLKRRGKKWRKIITKVSIFIWYWFWWFGIVTSKNEYYFCNIDLTWKTLGKLFTWTIGNSFWFLHFLYNLSTFQTQFTQIILTMFNCWNTYFSVNLYSINVNTIIK